MQNNYKTNMENALKSLPYKVGDKAYTLRQSKIEEYFIQKIELTLTSVKYNNCNEIGNEFKIMITLKTLDKIGSEICNLDEFEEKFSPTPSLAVEKIKSKFLNQMDRILNNYYNTNH